LTPPLSDLMRGRLLIATAAILWSTSGAFTKVLSKPTFLGLDDPPLDGQQMACFRVLFAGLVLVPLVKPREISFRPLMLFMMVSFAIMNYLFITAMRKGTAADAVLLQYTAPMWMFLASVWWLGERADWRSLIALSVGILGIAIIVVGGSREGRLVVVFMGLGSGVTFATVIICLRIMRDASSPWLTVLNHLGGALVLLPLLYFIAPPQPTPMQWLVLVLFGAGQLGIPYLLMARGLRTVSPQEAGTITLLEPLLNPVWAFLIAQEVPSTWTLVGGPFILAALVYRYWPWRRREKQNDMTGPSPAPAAQ
jgi:DME family drug/metabolite transporter